MVKKGTVLSLLRLRIVGTLFARRTGVTIKEIAFNLKTDYKNTHVAVEQLFEERIVLKEKIGNYTICKLNFHNDELLEYLKEYNFYISIREFKNKHSAAFNVLNETVNKMLEFSLKSGMYPFFISAVFGSYSKHDEKKESDMDVLVLGGKAEINQFDVCLKKK